MAEVQSASASGKSSTRWFAFRHKSLPWRRTEGVYFVSRSFETSLCDWEIWFGKIGIAQLYGTTRCKNGKGLCVVDPHGDLIEDILRYVPKERARDIIVFDPADTERPMGLNLLEANSPEQKDRASLDAMNIFIKLFGNEILVLVFSTISAMDVLTLMDDEEERATLIDLPRLLWMMHFKI